MKKEKPYTAPSYFTFMINDRPALNEVVVITEILDKNGERSSFHFTLDRDRANSDRLSQAARNAFAIWIEVDHLAAIRNLRLELEDLMAL